MLRVGPDNLIGRNQLKNTHQECMNRFKSFPQKSKSLWYRLAKDAEALLNCGDIPYNGLPVMGPFIGNNVSIPKPGQVIRLNSGIELYSNLPKLLGKKHFEANSREIRVLEVVAGHIGLPRGDVVDPMVCWQLREGYNAWTSLKNVEGVSIRFFREAS